ncbi:acetylornithine deacetylase [Pseudalkalibacillus sp. NRS-1564]|uniref:acetylornithine deacetylase n=1 Tax=Pseudalkalibacillus sp. NRS-1564 TaxID=3233900 RepID=UPI003D2AE29E
MVKKEIFNLVDERKQELINLTNQLIQYATPAPPARNTQEIQDFIASYLTDIGFKIDKWDMHPGDPIIVGILNEEVTEYQSLILNGHVDVAEVGEDENWSFPPFEPTISDNKVYGRGAADMKAGIAANLFALKLLKENNLPLKGKVLFQSVTGEEIGEAGTSQCCERGYTADFAVVADTSDLRIEGQGGVVTGWITVKDSKTHHDALRQNMIHSGGGLHGASAIEKMMKIIQALQDLERHWSIVKSYPGVKPGMTTINPAVIEGGRHAAFIADECKLWITVHYYPNETYQDVMDEIEDHIRLTANADIWLRDHPPTFQWGGTSMMIDKGEIFPSLEVDQHHPAVKLLSDLHEHIHFRRPEIGTSQTVTDGGWLGDAGIPTVIYGPGKLAQAHSTNEYVSIHQLINYTQSMMHFILDWVNTKKGAD